MKYFLKIATYCSSHVIKFVSNKLQSYQEYHHSPYLYCIENIFSAFYNFYYLYCTIFQTENPIVDNRCAEFAADYGNILPLENRHLRKRSFNFSKSEELWRLRFVRAVCLFDEKHQGRELSEKAKGHVKAFLLRHHSRVSCFIIK